jgi:transcriptional regulator with XRE-family HTH domain
LASLSKRLREAKKLSQGDIETQTGLIRCYTSRVENGHTVPSLETLEKFARALELPMYQLMFDGDEPPSLPKTRTNGSKNSWEMSPKGELLIRKLNPLLAKMDQADRQLILYLAHEVAKRRSISAQ